MELGIDETIAKVDLVEQITNRLTCGFPISPEDISLANKYGINIAEIADAVGAMYEDYDSEDSLFD